VLEYSSATLDAIDVANVVLESVNLGGNPVLADAEAGQPITMRYGVPLVRSPKEENEEGDVSKLGDSDEDGAGEDAEVRLTKGRHREIYEYALKKQLATSLDFSFKAQVASIYRKSATQRVPHSCT